jgi:type III restriction enzyme
VTTPLSIDNPILNGPYDPPSAHFELGPNGPTGEVKVGRRPSESFIPVPAPKKGRKSNGQQQIDTDLTGERREKNSLINDIRSEVDLWRARGYPGVTPITRKLLLHWADPERENRVLFCQREAAETAIFLAEAAGRHGADFRTRVDQANAEHNDKLPRVALKMATGSGKTVVMAMLIAWQTINKVVKPNDARFAKRFLIITPGITIRDRLRVLLPEDSGNYYRERDLIPPDLLGQLKQAEIAITNYHTFLLRDAKEIQGVASNTRKILTAGKKVDPFKETNDQMVARVLRDLGGASGRSSEIVMLSDEAHHCYQNKPLTDPSDEDAEAKQRNEDARVWFRGLQAIRKKVGIKAIYDLSATPFYLQGSGYNEGYIFPWVVSDFSLMDAIESGIVKVPRVPVDDNADTPSVLHLRLWDHVGTELPKRKAKATAAGGPWVPPPTLESALLSLHRSYEKSFNRWQADLEQHGEPPPVFIVVCPNTVVSKLVYDWIGGVDVERPDGSMIPKPGHLELLSNVDAAGGWMARPRTVLVDSAQLESGEALKPDFKEAAAHELETFKAEYRQRNPGADVDKLTDEDILREVMNTVGKPGRLGEHVRCVVSVSMLTEGWDANTVTHILGIRRFGSQLLCEQVVGRGLRRRSYAVNDEGRFEAEYAEVYGVPFAFIPTDRPVGPDVPKPPAIEVRALEERSELRISFPKLDGYRLELIDEPLLPDFSEESYLHVDRTKVATKTDMGGMVGAADEHQITEVLGARTQQVAYAIAKELVDSFYPALDEAPRPWLFPQLLDITRQWLDKPCVTFEPGTPVGMLLIAEWRHLAAERIFHSIVQQQGNQQELLRPMIRRFDPEGSTDDVSFFTRKVVIDTTKSHVSHVVLDGPKGNSWEETVAMLLEQHDSVAAYVKNDHLGFTVPYVHGGNSHQYIPDFLVRLVQKDDDEIRTLIVEVSGGRKSLAFSKTKAETARDQWCQSVNNQGGFGRWGYIEITDMTRARSTLDNAIDDLYADGFTTGLIS